MLNGSTVATGKHCILIIRIYCVNYEYEYKNLAATAGGFGRYVLWEAIMFVLVVYVLQMVTRFKTKPLSLVSL